MQGGQKKGPSKLAQLTEPAQDAAASPSSPWESPDAIMINFLLVENYARKTGRCWAACGPAYAQTMRMCASHLLPLGH